MSQPSETIQLSTGTWMKLLAVLVVHTAVLVWSGSRVVAMLEQRLTRVETNQELMLEFYRARIDRREEPSR